MTGGAIAPPAPLVLTPVCYTLWCINYHGLRRKYPFHALSEDWERNPICHNQLLKDNISIEEVDVHNTMFAVLDVSLST